jgi:outer membrane protein OmpA-like peptidoglycan-associated protein
MIDFRRFCVALGVTAVAAIGASPAWAQQVQEQVVGQTICNPLMTIRGDAVDDVRGDVVRTIASEPCPVVAAVETPAPPVEPAAPPPEPFILSEMVNFEFDRSEILPQFEPVLNEVAAALSDNQDEVALLVGHTDSIGDPTYNMGLAERRAESVANYLQAQGVTQEQLVLQARGEEEPIATNETPEGRFMNRRVEITAGAPGA